MRFSRLIVALGFVVCLASNARAMGDYDDSQAHPLVLLYYVLHPIAYAAEWLVTRPFHRLVSQDDLAPISGYTSHTGFDYETYQEGLSTGVSFEPPEDYTRRYSRNQH
jgi:hypothetical protein